MDMSNFIHDFLISLTSSTKLMERVNLREVLRSRYPEGGPSSVEWLTAVSKKRVEIIGNDRERMRLRKSLEKKETVWSESTLQVLLIIVFPLIYPSQPIP